MSDFRRDRRPSCARWTEKIGSRKAAFFCALPAQRGFYRSATALHRCSPHRVGTRQRGIFSFSKENIPLTPPRERPRLAVQSLNDLCASGMRLPARGVAALGVAIRFASAPIIRCRSAHLVEVRSNSRLPPVSAMRRAKQCRYFARSPPPSKRHSRLTIVRRGCKTVTIRRDSWRSHVHRTRLRSVCSSSSCKLPMSGVEGTSLRVLLGVQGGYSLT